MPCSERFTDKIAVITGATGGLGSAIAHRFAAEDATVVLTGRDPGKGAGVTRTLREAGGRAEFIAADLRRDEDIDDVPIVRNFAERVSSHPCSPGVFGRAPRRHSSSSICLGPPLTQIKTRAERPFNFL